jgi:hypothetical protein
MDVEDDNLLVSDSAFVISSPSTMAFKSIQKGIPTVVLNNHGMMGNFFDYKGLVDCDRNAVINSINTQLKEGRDEKFIKETIEGGIDFNSTHIYIDMIDNIIKKPYLCGAFSNKAVALINYHEPI